MYTFNSRVRYSEMNFLRGSMDPSSIINYFQDCSTFQSEDLNIGLSYLQEKHRAWLLTGWQLQILKPTLFGDNITIGTWAYGMKSFYGYRNFIMKNEYGEVLSIADSLWVYIDTLTNRPARIPADNGGYTLEPPYPMEHTDRKIAIPVDLITYPSFPVRKANIDSNNHVNNGQYIKMAEEFLPDTFPISSMRVEYKMQALLGDIIVPKVSKTENYYYVILEDEKGKPYAITEFKKS